MVQRYSEWDKKKYKTTRSLPWWMKNIRLMQYIGWGTVFFWAFGSIYKTLLLGSTETAFRPMNQEFGEDANRWRKNIHMRELKLAREGIFNFDVFYTNYQYLIDKL